MLCRLLIQLGATTDAVTSHQQTPLLLAARLGDSIPRYEDSYRRHDGAFGVNTVRVLVQQGKNDPMHADFWGRTPVLVAAGNVMSKEVLPWLLNQDDFEIDFEYKTPSGYNAAAYISTREDFPDLLAPIINSGITVNNPCARYWYSYILPRDRLGGRS